MHVRIDEPGQHRRPERSMTLAPAGTCTFDPTAVMRSPCTRITAFLIGAAPVPSIKVPARIAVTGPCCNASNASSAITKTSL